MLQKHFYGDIIFTGKYSTNDSKINQSVGDSLNKLCITDNMGY